VNSKKEILQAAGRLAWLLGKEGLDRIPNCVKREQTNISVVLAECVKVCRLSSLSREASGSSEERRNQTSIGIRCFADLLLRSLWVGPFRSSIRLSCSTHRGFKAELFMVREETARSTGSSVLCVRGVEGLV